MKEFNLYDISICLYDQPYDVVKLTWIPSEFLQRIHFWLARTATGTLHGADQPLEPLMAVSPHQLVLPADFNTTNPKLKPKPFNMVQVEGGPPVNSLSGPSTIKAGSIKPPRWPLFFGASHKRMASSGTNR